MERKPRAGGMTGKPVTQTAIPLKIDNDLLERLDDYILRDTTRKRNRLINSAIRQYLDRLDNAIVQEDNAV